MSKIKLTNVLKLSVSEQLKLVEMIWDSISEFLEAIPMTEKQSEELDNRLEDYANNPGGNISWEQAKIMILNRK